MTPPSRARRIRALLGAEARALARDRWTTLSLLLMMVAVGFAAHAGAWLPTGEDEDEEAEEERPPATWACAPGEVGAIALSGPVPDWLSWPDPVVPVEQALVLVRLGPPAEVGARQEIEVVALAEEAPTERVERCLRSQRDEARALRLAALGLTEAPGGLARSEDLLPADGAAPVAVRPVTAPLGPALASGLFLLLVSLYLELGPRARASGWVEAWLGLPGHRSDLVWAWWLVGLSAGTLGVALILLGHFLGAALSGQPAEPVTWSTVPPMVLLASALGLRVFLDVDDMRMAITRSMPVVFAVTLLAGVALAVEERWPDLGGLVPVAGLGLAMAGRTTAAGTGLAIASALLTTAALLASSMHTLEALPARIGALSRTAARRAAGNYRPEVLLLTLVAMAGSSSWVPPALAQRDIVLATALSMVTFLLLPAVLVSGPLGLPRGALLSWRPPPARAWLLLPLLLAGSLSSATLLWHGAVRVLPSNETLALYTEVMAAFDSPAGLLVISLVPGIAEELLFRGAILGLLRKGMATWAAVLVQAALFALLHGLALRFPYTLGLGLLFGLLVVRTGSLWPAMALHAAHNLMGARWGELPPGPDSPWVWLAAGVGVVAAWMSGAPARR